jgi:hypothetical protein
MVAGTSRSSSRCATRATARTWLSRRCAAVRSAELATANAASSMSTPRCDASLPGRPLVHDELHIIAQSGYSGEVPTSIGTNRGDQA